MKTTLSTECVLAAYDIAADAHRGQTRADGVCEYFEHPSRVAALVRLAGGSTVAVIAALLHDTVEDCAGFDLDAALAAIPLTESDRVRTRDVVIALTHAPNEPNTTYFARVLAAPSEAILVKLADRLDNVLDMDAGFTEERARRYCSKTKILVAMARSRSAEIGLTDLLEAVDDAVGSVLHRLNTPGTKGAAAA